jgi:hypothetical protein
MPNLVVYVPADVARALEANGVSENLQRRACKEVLIGLANGELGSGEAPLKSPPVAGAGRSPEPSSRCSREARHHINHGGKPCPECGYPTFKEGAVT